ncbi:ervatamin-B-like [Vicia villosa]|uniref:ervatamin-B-like n=1 Tax=Vicia villosa TaxID=3911 RepID=UPI00273C1F3B|nr:ervatamin-B-like [Vicia villosa]
MISHTINQFLFFTIFTTFLCLSSCEDDIPNKYSTILGPNNDKLPTQDEAIQLFQLWKKEHGRVYNDLALMSKKFGIFLSNLRIITNANRERKSSDDILLGLTDFADMSSKDFQESYLYDIDMSSNTMKPQDDDQLQSVSIPRSWDWRLHGAVTEVRDQIRPCKSCWAMSAVGAIEGITAIKTKILNPLSVQELLDCDKHSFGCDGGFVSNAYDWVIKKKGMTDEHDYPYTARKGPTCKASLFPKRANIYSYYGVKGYENDMLTATYQQPISSCLYVVPEDFQHYIRGIYDGRNCPEDPKLANHCMLIVGYDTALNQDFWIVKNSWGKTWGADGYMFIKRNNGRQYGVCGINAWASYPYKL